MLDRHGRISSYLGRDDSTALQHNVVEAEHVGLPAAVYEVTGDERYLNGEPGPWEKMQRYLSPDGTPFGSSGTDRAPMRNTAAQWNG